jgi:hypothetical protein
MAARLGVEPEKVAAYESGAWRFRLLPVHVAQECGIDLTCWFPAARPTAPVFLVRQGEGLSVERRKDYDYRAWPTASHGRRMEPS